MTRYDAKDPTLIPKEKTRLRQIIDRVWSPYLSPADWKVLTFIFTTTIEWSKPQDRLKIDHFINGLTRARGVGLSDKTIRVALDGLDRDGAISRKRTPYGYVIAILFDWEPETVRTPRTRAAVSRKTVSAVAVRPVSPAEKPEEIGNSYRSRSVEITDAYKEGDTRKEIPLINRPSGGDAPSRIPKKLPAKSHAYVDPLDKRNLRAVFAKEAAEAFPDIVVPPWGRGQEMQACKFVEVNKAKRANALAVFAWSVREWRLIITTRFAWMTKSPPPEFPSIGFMVAFRDGFYDAWNDRERLRLDAEAKPQQRRIRKLMRTGMTPEEAVAKTAKADKDAELRSQLARVRAERDDAYRRAEAATIAAGRARPSSPNRLPLKSEQPMSMANSVARDEDF